jgi:hypothetical protein
MLADGNARAFWRATFLAIAAIISLTGLVVAVGEFVLLR